VGRRIEVELTSTREDGSWTWRAAGAKQPKGELSGDLLYGGAKVGDVVKVEADFHLDGIEVVEVFPPKAKKERTDLLELKSRPLRDDELVTTQRASRGRGRDDRGRRGDRPGRSKRGERGDRGDRRGGSGPRTHQDRPQRPKPKRLRPKREHRNALLDSVAEEHRPIVEQVISDGMPGVRAAIEKQNAEAKQAGKPEIDAAPIMAIAERNLNAARLAEWRDRADAALSDITELDLRDLRSVVVVGGDVARDDESRALADKLKAALDERMESDHAQWLSDLRSAVGDGRVVRALRLSSRPVKAGAPLPTELAGELSRQAAAALAPDVEQDRWAVVLDALAFSPVRGAVAPAGVPAEPKESLLDEVRRLSDRIPAIAGLFGIDPATVPKRAKRRRPNRPGTRDRGGKQPASSSKGEGRPRRGEAQPKAARAEPKPTGDEPVASPVDDATPAPAPAEEPQAPMAEDVTPPEELEAPTVEDVTPAEEPQAATAEDVTPAEEPQVATAEEVTPPEKPQAPTAEGATPAEEPQAPTAEGVTPAEEPQAATAERATPPEEPQAATAEEVVPAAEPAVEPSGDAEQDPESSVSAEADGDDQPEPASAETGVDEEAGEIEAPDEEE